MVDEEIDDIWKPWDEKVGLLFLQIPNCVIKDIITKGKLNLIEIRVFLYICRMDLGFQKNKGQTQFLYNTEIAKETGLSDPQVSDAIEALIKKQFILQGVKRGKAFKYSVNLLRYGLKMNRYRITEDFRNLDKGEDVYDLLIYLLGKNIREYHLVILYNPKGYNNAKEGKTKKDIPSNGRKKDLASVFSEFKTEIKKNSSLKILLRYMNISLSLDTPYPYPVLVEYYESFATIKDKHGHVTEHPENMKIYNKAVQLLRDWQKEQREKK